MSDLAVIAPSRNRPHAIAELADTLGETCTAQTELIVAIDADDPHRADYFDVVAGRSRVDIVVQPAGGTMVSALNLAVQDPARCGTAVAFMGDDHRPRTPGWDARYVEALAELGTGMVYGNDLLQRGNLPTQIAMTSDIVQALGWMAPPVLRHLYVDNFWRDLGHRAGCIRYLDDVVVEHMHPVAGKAQWDAGHQRVNSREMYTADQAAYEQLKATGALAAAVAVVEGLRG